MQKISLNEKFDLFDEIYVPKIVGQLNGQYVKIVKCKGEYTWHHHDNEDELFMVVKGNIIIHLRDQSIELNEGEFLIVPAGIEHKPEAPDVAHVLLFEPMSTRNTGNVDHEYTIEPDDLEEV